MNAPVFGKTVSPPAPSVEQFEPIAAPLERRRLQSYLALMIGDIFGIFGGFGFAGYLYLGWEGVADALVQAQGMLPIYLTIALYGGCYNIGVLDRPSAGMLRAVFALFLSAATIVFIAFYTKSSTEFSRVAFTVGGLMATGMLVWTRTQLRSFVRWRCGDTVINQLVIDDGGPPISLPGAIFVSALDFSLESDLGNPHALDRIGLVLRNIDRVVVSCPPERRGAWSMILKGANVAGEVLDDAVVELGAKGARQAGGHGWLLVSTGPLGLRARAAKRVFDIVLAGTALILMSPVMLAVALAVLIEDGRPILFIQRRVGRGNRFFDIAKFRSMAKGEIDHDGIVSTAREDDRITRVGKFIRRTSLDELPQLFNVLRGDMSLVGPRPHAIGSQAGDKLFWEVDARYWQRHSLRPGLTGLAQIRGLRGATHAESDLAERLRADLEYLEGWTIWRDIRIILLTLDVRVHDSAY